MTKEQINKLCNKLINNEALTTKSLMDISFSNKDIIELVDTEIIKETTTEEYHLVNVDILYEYGLSLLQATDYIKAIDCFEKCYEIDNNHRDSCLQVFCNCIRNKNYDRAFELLDTLYNTNDINLIKENNLYLYLLNFLVPCPKRYIKLVKSIERDDLGLTDCDKDDATTLISRIMDGNIYLALSLIREIKSNTPVKKDILKKLLLNCTNYRSEEPKIILNYLQNEQYDELETLLTNRTKTKKFSATNKHILILVTLLKKITKTEEIPNITILDTYSVFEAIRGNNFELALKLNREYLNKKNITEDDAIGILLKRINILVEEINKPVELKDISSLLTNGQIEKFLKILKKYLKQINKEEFEYLIVGLTKLSLLDQNVTSDYILNEIIKLENNKNNTISSNYIKKFYLYLEQNKIQEANICLKILAKYCGKSPNIVEELKYGLNNKNQNETNIKLLEFLDIAKQMRIHKEIIHILYNVSPIENHLILSLIHNKLTLEENFSNLRVISFGEDSKTIILRYVDQNQKEQDYKKIIDNIIEQYFSNQYSECANNIRLLFQNPNYNNKTLDELRLLFDMLANCYLNFDMNRKKVAKKYLTIVTELNKHMPNSEIQYDYTSLINQLSLEIEQDKKEEKPLIKKLDHINRN